MAAPTEPNLNGSPDSVVRLRDDIRMLEGVLAEVDGATLVGTAVRSLIDERIAAVAAATLSR
jgi:hypothetical protein